MTTLIGYQEIDDHEHRLPSPTREELFGPPGVGEHTFLGPENPKRAAVLLEVPDPAAIQDAVESEAAAEAMIHDRVHGGTAPSWSRRSLRPARQEGAASRGSRA